jgi:hypothetical protein
MKELVMNATFNTGGQVISRSHRSVVALSGHPQPGELLDVLIDASEYDVICLESLARGYSRIKQLIPDLIVVFMDADDDVAVCQLLSMLTIDRDMCGIPVVTRRTRHKDNEIEEIIDELIRESSALTDAIQMN